MCKERNNGVCGGQYHFHTSFNLEEVGVGGNICVVEMGENGTLTYAKNVYKCWSLGCCLSIQDTKPNNYL